MILHKNPERTKYNVRFNPPQLIFGRFLRFRVCKKFKSNFPHKGMKAEIKTENERKKNWKWKKIT